MRSVKFYKRSVSLRMFIGLFNKEELVNSSPTLSGISKTYVEPQKVLSLSLSLKTNYSKSSTSDLPLGF